MKEKDVIIANPPADSLCKRIIKELYKCCSPPSFPMKGFVDSNAILQNGDGYNLLSKQTTESRRI